MSGFLGEGIQDLGSAVIGRSLCHPKPGGELVIEWTVEPLMILAQAVGTDPKKLGDWQSAHFDLRIESTVEAVNAKHGQDSLALWSSHCSCAFPSHSGRTACDHRLSR